MENSLKMRFLSGFAAEKSRNEVYRFMNLKESPDMDKSGKTGGKFSVSAGINRRFEDGMCVSRSVSQARHGLKNAGSNQ